MLEVLLWKQSHSTKSNNPSKQVTDDDDDYDDDTAWIFTMARWKTPPTGPSALASAMRHFVSSSVLTSRVDTSTSTPWLSHSFTRFAW